MGSRWTLQADGLDVTLITAFSGSFWVRVTSGHSRIIITMAVIKTGDKIIISLGGTVLSTLLCVCVPVEGWKCVHIAVM